MEIQGHAQDQHAVNVSQVEIVPFRPSRGFVGFATCVLNGMFYLADIALFTRPGGGLRLGYPIKKLSDGSTVELFRVLDRSVGSTIERAITDKYEAIMNLNGNREDHQYGKPYSTHRT